MTYRRQNLCRIGRCDGAIDSMEGEEKAGETPGGRTFGCFTPSAPLRGAGDDARIVVFGFIFVFHTGNRTGTHGVPVVSGAMRWHDDRPNVNTDGLHPVHNAAWLALRALLHNARSAALRPTVAAPVRKTVWLMMYLSLPCAAYKQIAQRMACVTRNDRLK